MKKSAMSAGILVVCAAVAILAGCQQPVSTTAPTITLNSRPSLPKPSCYSCHVPNTSPMLVLETKNLTLPFTPTVTQVVFQGQGAATNVNAQTIAFTDSNGNLIASPQLTDTTGLSNPGNLPPLSSHPLIQIVDFWQKLGQTQRYPNGTTTSYTVTQTTGTTTSQTSSFGLTVGATVSIGPDAFSAELSSEFSADWTNSVEVSSEQSTSKTFTASPAPGSSLVYVVWQLVYEVRIVRKATSSEIASGLDGGTGYVPFDDPNYTFVDPQNDQAYVDPVTGTTINGVAPVALQQSVSVPDTTSFSSTS